MKIIDDDLMVCDDPNQTYDSEVILESTKDWIRERWLARPKNEEVLRMAVYET